MDDEAPPFPDEAPEGEEQDAIEEQEPAPETPEERRQRRKDARESLADYRRFVEKSLLQSPMSLAVGEETVREYAKPDGTIGRIVTPARVNFSSTIEACAALARRVMDSRDELGNPTREAARMAIWFLDKATPKRFPPKASMALTVNNNTHYASIKLMEALKPATPEMRANDDVTRDWLNAETLRITGETIGEGE